MEDSAFITPQGDALYFFFTPSARIPPEDQLKDGVTGIYLSVWRGSWTRPERVLLSDGLSLDGCPFVAGSEMWFCSVRAGNFTSIDLYIAEFRDGRWLNWRNAGERLNKEFQVGEVHLLGDTLYFDSLRAGGRGGKDIWVSRRVAGEWQEPENLPINTPGDEYQPFLTVDGQELWFTRTYQGSPAIFRARRVEDTWGPPELIISQFAAEPSIDAQGNLYFIHHFFQDGLLIEADIYVAKKKTPND